jgi:hypothetical protein
MGTVKGEIRGSVIKTGRRTKVSGSMAGSAITCKRALMIIIMTGCTLGLKTEICVFAFPDLAVYNIIRSMARPAIHCSVPPCQRIASVLMVKRFCVKTNHVEFPPMMIAVTGKAILLPYLHLCMQAPVRTYQ